MWYLQSILVLLVVGNVLAEVSQNVFKYRDVDDLIAKANIYYQQPSEESEESGETTELTLQEVEELNTKDEVKLIIHGFEASRKHVSISPLGNAYLATGVDNILIADWSEAAAMNYLAARRSVRDVGRHFGKLLDEFLIRHEIAPSAVHVIGHSLGAHIAGNLGVYFNGTLGRVTGLDPALPLFSAYAEDSLHATAAQFVDVIHTDYPLFGDETLRGHADFYPHFGRAPQPGCEEISLQLISDLLFEESSCSHSRAVLLYAESIELPDNFPTLPCTWNGIKTRDFSICLERLETTGLNRTTLEEAIISADDERVIYMGEAVARTATGCYYFETYASSPYGKGINSRY